jgi:hypothetical protein
MWVVGWLLLLLLLLCLWLLLLHKASACCRTKQQLSCGCLAADPTQQQTHPSQLKKSRNLSLGWQEHLSVIRKLGAGQIDTKN